jgi:aminomethyltransferase
VSDDLLSTPLYDLHVALGGRMVGFAGYSLPVQYPAGILKEHLQVRSLAGLFDVSHMGQVRLDGAAAAAALETLVPGDIVALKPGRIRYTMLTNDAGGIIDDLMVTNMGDHLFLVVNAANKAADIALIRAGLEPKGVVVSELADRALLALQGPAAAAVLGRLAPDAAALPFMAAAPITLCGIACFVSRSGYTGEDGFEISVPGEHATTLARALLDEPEVAPAGLGARDSLRLEAGLCLHGHDIDAGTTPVEADLGWTMSKRRRSEGGFPGAAIVQRQLAEGATRKRVGLQPQGRMPVREGATLQAVDGTPVGKVTSGGFGPTLNGPVGMAYVATGFSAAGTVLIAEVRGKSVPCVVTPMPIVPHNYPITRKSS